MRFVAVAAFCLLTSIFSLKTATAKELHCTAFLLQVKAIAAVSQPDHQNSYINVDQFAMGSDTGTSEAPTTTPGLVTVTIDNNAGNEGNFFTDLWGGYSTQIIIIVISAAIISVLVFIYLKSGKPGGSQRVQQGKKQSDRPSSAGQGNRPSPNPNPNQYPRQMPQQNPKASQARQQASNANQSSIQSPIQSPNQSPNQSPIQNSNQSPIQNQYAPMPAPPAQFDSGKTFVLSGSGAVLPPSQRMGDSPQKVTPVEIHLTLEGISGYYSGTSLTLSKYDQLVIGRDKGSCNLLYPGDYKLISGIHLRIFFDIDKNAFILADQGSTNGTFIKGGKKLISNEQFTLENGTEFYLATEQNAFRATYER